MNDDFLNEDFTVDEKMGRKIIEKQTKEIEEWWQFLKDLHTDYKLAKRTCADQPKVPFLRRIQIRNFCALVEAQIHVWKLLTKKFHRMLQAELTDGEISILDEKAYELDDKGNLQETCYELCQVKSWRSFFLKSFFSVLLSSWVRGWKRFPGIGNGVSRCSTCYPCTALNRDGTS